MKRIAKWTIGLGLALFVSFALPWWYGLHVFGPKQQREAATVIH
jgi:hypothetical protein